HVVRGDAEGDLDPALVAGHRPREGVADASEEGGVLLRHFGRAERLSELTHEFPLLAGQPLRDDDEGPYQEVTTAAAAQVRDTPAPDHVHLPGLDAALQLEFLGVALERRDVDLDAQRSLCDVERQVVHQVLVHPLEDRVLLHRQLHVEVSGRAAVHAGVALSRDADLGTFVHPGWNADAALHACPADAGATTLRAGVGDDLALAPAAVARGDVDELA